MTLPIIFRTTDNTKWGAGNGADLTASQVDLNFWALKDAVEQLQTDMPAISVGIDTFSVSNSSFYVHLTDGSTEGPYDLPIATWTFQGSWTASTAYFLNDVVTNGYGVYLVIFDHTSNASFDPYANDGSGNDYYQLIISFEPFAVPVGGTTGQVLAKASNTDHDMTWYTIPEPVSPPGDNVMPLTYLSGDLIVGGDLSVNPTTVFPSWAIGTTIWSPGQLTITYSGPGDAKIIVPVDGLEIGQWYSFEYTGFIQNDVNFIDAEFAFLYAYSPGSNILVFQASATADNISIDLLNYTDGATRTITSVSCYKIEQPVSVKMTLGDVVAADFGMPDGNVLIGGNNAVNRPVYGASATPVWNTIAIGSGAIENSEGISYSIAIGTSALQNNNSSNNIAIGHEALRDNISNSNIAIGNGAMFESAYGIDNIVIGHYISGVRNSQSSIFIGGNNTARAISGGSFNVIIGQDAVVFAADDSYITAIGHGAGYYAGGDATVAQGCTFIGANADFYRNGFGVISSITNAIAIGYNAKVQYSNSVQFGNTSVVSAYIGNKAVGLPKHLLVNGAAAGNVTVTGINTGDRLDEVIYYPAAGGVFDLTTEFTISATNTINNSGGTVSTGGKLIVRWTSLT